VIFSTKRGPGSVIGLATGYGLDGAGSNPVGGEIFLTCPDRPWGPPSLLYNGNRVFPGGKERPGREADLSPPFSAVVMKEYTYTSTPHVDRTACTEPQCLYKGALYLFLLYQTLTTYFLQGTDSPGNKSAEFFVARWPCGLRPRFSTALLLGFRFRFPLVVGIFCFF